MDGRNFLVIIVSFNFHVGGVLILSYQGLVNSTMPYAKVMKPEGIAQIPESH